MVKCVVRGCPPGLGDPVFDKLDATLAHAMMSIPATTASAVGSGLEAAGMTGLEHNDPFYTVSYTHLDVYKRQSRRLAAVVAMRSVSLTRNSRAFRTMKSPRPRAPATARICLLYTSRCV